MAPDAEIDVADFITTGELHMTRFKPGDRVKILPTVATPFVGLEGTIHEVLPHDRGITTLDRYVVVFEWGEKQLFFDAQLAHIENKIAVRH